ncbi:hypothetical protein BaRGS_00012468 [Batillaria attramentaria]|uniref:Uncharacterized protein n=1 Tax=Batillaria attramentaria TaxID=370345 RepID=A0ABD0LAP4_9CAEN
MPRLRGRPPINIFLRERDPPASTPSSHCFPTVPSPPFFSIIPTPALAYSLVSLAESSQSNVAVDRRSPVCIFITQRFHFVPTSIDWSGDTLGNVAEYRPVRSLWAPTPLLFSKAHWDGGQGNTSIHFCRLSSPRLSRHAYLTAHAILLEKIQFTVLEKALDV